MGHTSKGKDNRVAEKTVDYDGLAWEVSEEINISKWTTDSSRNIL